MGPGQSDCPVTPGLYDMYKEGVANLPRPHRLPDRNFTRYLSFELGKNYVEYMESDEQKVAERMWGCKTPISFRYRVSRHKTIKVKGWNPVIRHIPDGPLGGHGTKGFWLGLRVARSARILNDVTLRGIRRRPRYMEFRLSRIRDMSIPLPEWRRRKNGLA